MKRDPIEIVHSIAEALRKMPSGETAKVNDVAVPSSVHWTTARNYLDLISFVQAKLPRIVTESVGGTRVVRVVSNPWWDDLSIEARFMALLYNSKASTRAKALPIPAEYADVAADLERQGAIRKTSDAKSYLTPSGMTRAIKVISTQVDTFDREFGDLWQERQLVPTPDRDLRARVEVIEAMMRAFASRLSVGVEEPAGIIFPRFGREDAVRMLRYRQAVESHARPEAREAPRLRYRLRPQIPTDEHPSAGRPSLLESA